MLIIKNCDLKKFIRQGFVSASFDWKSTNVPVLEAIVLCSAFLFLETSRWRLETGSDSWTDIDWHLHWIPIMLFLRPARLQNLVAWIAFVTAHEITKVFIERFILAYVWTRQKLLHDVDVVNLSTASQPLLLRVQLFILFNLKRTKQDHLRRNPAISKRTHCVFLVNGWGIKPLESARLKRVITGHNQHAQRKSGQTQKTWVTFNKSWTVHDTAEYGTPARRRQSNGFIVL